MSDNEEKKLTITFSDKEDSYILNSNSKYVLTAANVNEIKEVVNNLHFEFETIDLFSDLMRYVRFVVPDYLKERAKYDFIMELSLTPDFANASTLSISASSDKFYIFDGTWKSFTSERKTDIRREDANKSIKIDIKDVLQNVGNAYFGRYRWFNKTTSLHSEWKGFVLGSYGYYNDDFDADEESSYKAEISGMTLVDEDTSASYKLLVVKRNGEKIDITNSATFSSLNNFQISGSTINFGKTHDYITDLIKGSGTYNGRTYEAYLNVEVKPIILERIEFVAENNDDLLNVMEGIAKYYKIIAYYSDGSTKDVTKIATTNICLANSTISEIAGRKCIIGQGSFDTFGYIEASYSDEDFSQSETVHIVKYLKFVKNSCISLDVTVPDEINYGNTSNKTYYVRLNKRDGSTLNVTNTVSMDVINGDELSFVSGNIVVDESKMGYDKTASVIFTYRENDDYHNDELMVVKPIKINGEKLIDFNFAFANGEEMISVNENSSITYGLSGIIKNAKTGETRLEDTYGNSKFEYDIDVKSSNNNVVVNKVTKTIEFGKFRTNETVVLKISVTYKGTTIEHLHTVLVKPVYLKKIDVRGDFIVDMNTNHNYAIEAVYSDGTVVNVTDKAGSSIKIAAGNTSAAMIDGKKIYFNEITSSREIVTFSAEYNDEDFEDEHAFKFFTVTIRNN